MCLSEITNNFNKWVPKEASMSVLGIASAATSALAIQFLKTTHSPLPAVLNNFIRYNCRATAIAGTVVALYSAVQLCKKINGEDPQFGKAAITTALGCLATTVALTALEYFAEIAPTFYSLNGHSMAYCAVTNLAFNSACITTLAGTVFVGYAAYRAGKAFFYASTGNEP